MTTKLFNKKKLELMKNRSGSTGRLVEVPESYSYSI